jgi:glycosyltransferase involved in cell wall biosynthesis
VATTFTVHMEELQRAGFITHPLFIDRSSGNLNVNLHSFYAIFKVLKKVRPSLVHLVTIKPFLIGGIAARLAGVPAVVAAVSGLGYVFISKGFIAWCRRLVVANLYRIVIGHPNIRVVLQNSEDAAALSIYSGLTETKISLIRGSGVDLKKYVPYPIPSEDRIVVMASRLLLDKGVAEFVAASRILRPHYFESKFPVRFVLVGKPDLGNPTSVSSELLDAWVKEGVIEYWGFTHDMPKVLSAATVVTLPSYREGLPKVLIEAAACARPVVTSDCAGCRDAIESGVTGLLVPTRNAIALANAIQNLLDDPNKCAAMGQAGRKLAERAFDVQQVVAAHMQIYQDLIKDVAL